MFKIVISLSEPEPIPNPSANFLKIKNKKKRKNIGYDLESSSHQIRSRTTPLLLRVGLDEKNMDDSDNNGVPHYHRINLFHSQRPP